MYRKSATGVLAFWVVGGLACTHHSGLIAQKRRTQGISKKMDDFVTAALRQVYSPIHPRANVG
jgi:hypothetical protein